MISPSKALLQFQRQFCPSTPIDSAEIISILLDKINGKDMEREEDEKQNES